MIRRRRMPNACSKKTEPCANCWPPRSAPSCLARPARSGAGRWLISAPGATLVRWRSLLGREDAPPITGRRVGWATLTTLYTLAIYGALVLLVVLEHTQFRSAPARRPPAPCGCRYSPCSRCRPGTGTCRQRPGRTRHASGASRRRPRPPPRHQHPQSMHRRARHADTPETETPATVTPQPAPAPAPVPTLRITEIPAEPRDSWLDALKAELQRCAGELLRPAGLRLGRTQAILRTQPRMGHRQGMPCSPMNGPWTRRSAHPRPRLASSGTSEKYPARRSRTLPETRKLRDNNLPPGSFPSRPRRNLRHGLRQQRRQHRLAMRDAQTVDRSRPPCSRKC